MTFVLRWPWRLALAVIGGVLLWAAFPPIGWGWLAVPATALFALAAWSSSLRLAVLTGFLGGLIFFLALLSWMTIVGTDAWLALSAFCALWFALLQVGSAMVCRLPAAPVWIATLWVLQEALRGRVPWGGFPWGELAFAAPNSPWSAPLSWIATSGLTFLLALLGALLAQAVARGGRRSLAPLAIAAALGLVMWVLPLASVSNGSSAPVAVVQGGTPQWGMGAMDVRRAVLDNHVSQTLELAQAVAAGEADQPDLVVWPENSTDIDPFTDPSVAEAITSAARAVAAPILVGAVIDAEADREGVWNVGVLWTPAGIPEQMYVKNHPVPFGEFIPFREQIAPLIGRFDRVPRDFLPGERPGVFESGGIVFGDVICFEIAYADVVDAVVDGGAQFLTVQTNNATYGGTAQPQQQYEISRARAIEQGREVAIASTTGISGFVGKDGSPRRTLGQGEVGWLVDKVDLRSGFTPANRYGHLVEIVLCLVAIGSVATVIILGLRRRSAPRPVDSSNVVR